MNDNTRNIQLSDIKIKDRKRQLKQDKVKELAGSIKQSGLIHPITLDEHFNLLAGLHRIEAVKLLGWQDIPARIMSRIDALEAELIEIDENLIRNELSVFQQGEWLVRRDDLLKKMGLRAQSGFNGNQYTDNLGGGESPPPTFEGELDEQPEAKPEPKTTEDIAKEAGMSKSTAQYRKRMFNNIDEKVREKIYGTELEDRATDLLYISRQGKDKQNEIVDRMLSTGRTLSQVRHDIAKEETRQQLEDTKVKEAKALSGKYDVIVIDPPWDIKKIDRDTVPDQANFDYPTMTLEEIKALEIPYADNCHLFLWTTHKYLPLSFDILNHWKAKYICTFVWHKSGGFQPFNLPQYNCEFCLYARFGTPDFVDLSDFKVCFDGTRGKHSEKPEEFYNVLRRVTAGRRLDMFNRRKINGFDGWGKESV